MAFTILHTESSKGWGGQENRIFLESIGLKNRGARVIILCQPDSIIARKASENGIEIRICRMEKSYDAFAVRNILKLLKAEKIDIISTHSGRDSLLAGIAGRLSGRKPVIVRMRHLALPITSRLTYSLLPHKVVTTSEYVRQYLISLRIPPEKIIAAPTGVDMRIFNIDAAKDVLKKELNIDDDTNVIGTVAILRFKKGHHILIEAVPEVLKVFPKTVFVFAGDGPQEGNIKNKIKELNLTDKVFLLGLRQDIPDILKSLDIFALPTLQESLPQSVLQAMAMGKPVIGTKVGGVPEVVEDGTSGILVEPENPHALAEAIIGLLKDKERMKKMGDAGRKIVEEKYSVDAMVERMYNFYESLIGKRKR
ncbi:MAG: glycosyltransferase family 4 protein [Deltaproteobacteria bacterium]|nr:glycosyltransferase family 4 protein [Deltaproteobacteria bacterium]